MRQKLIGLDEVSEYLGVSKPTIYAWVWQKKIPYIKVGGRLRFSEQAIESWLERRAVDLSRVYEG